MTTAENWISDGRTWTNHRKFRTKFVRSKCTKISYNCFHVRSSVRPFIRSSVSENRFSDGQNVGFHLSVDSFNCDKCIFYYLTELFIVFLSLNFWIGGTFWIFNIIIYKLKQTTDFFNKNLFRCLSRNFTDSEEILIRFNLFTNILNNERKFNYLAFKFTPVVVKKCF